METQPALYACRVQGCQIPAGSKLLCVPVGDLFYSLKFSHPPSKNQFNIIPPLRERFHPNSNIINGN